MIIGWRAKISESVGQTKHEVLCKHSGFAVFDIGIGNFSDDAFVLIKQIVNADSGFQRAVAE